MSSKVMGRLAGAACAALKDGMARAKTSRKANVILRIKFLDNRVARLEVLWLSREEKVYTVGR
jgi:hypothetical protein